MLKKLLAYAVFTSGMFLLLLGATLIKLSDLSPSLRAKSLWPILAGLVLVLGGLFLGQRMFFTLSLSLLLAWVGLAILIFVNQDLLLFSPRGLSESRLKTIALEYPASEEITVETKDKVTLHGWLLPGEKQPAPLIIVFGGQGTEASRQLKLQSHIPEFAWAFFNYRGYGLSTGIPTEADFLADALAIYDELQTHPLVDPDYIFALGGSLGTGVATYLAAQRPLTAVALFSPYDKIGGGVAQDLLPLLPTGFLIRNTFQAKKWAPKAQAPALAVIGSEDKLIFPQRSENLMNHWAHEVFLHYVPGGDHYSIYHVSEVWGKIRKFFLERLP